MTARTKVPEWCRADVEDAISDAVTRWVLNRVDRMGENATPTNALSVIFALASGDRQEVARDVIAALQGVGVPFSGATGAGAEHESIEKQGDVDDAVLRLDVLRRSLEPTADAHAIGTVLRALAHRTAAGDELAAAADLVQPCYSSSPELSRLYRAERAWTCDAMRRDV